jgi:lipopolysaccharide transport system ATP-binding protein
MSKDVISVEHLTKQYDLGVIGTGTISRDLERWWARVRKQPDPYTRIGQKDAFARIGESILALDDVSFTVQQGEALGIIGRNGAGKSTLLKILSRVTAPTSGVVKVKGRIGSLLEVGTGFHPELTGRENVYLNGAILGMKKAEVARKFDEIVDFSGVERFIDTPVKRYSSGMYVRLAFAVAAHLDPEILIVDEVLAVGDAEFQKKCLGKMGDVAGQGRTVLFVSHNMSAIKTLCNRCMLITGGKLGNFGETDVIVDQYIASSIKQQTVTLSDRIDRTGTGIVRFTVCEISKDLNGKMTTNCCTGDHLFISLTLKAEEKTEVFIGLQLVDTMEKTITSFNSREGGVTFILNPGRNDILVEIPFLSILEGDYSINGSIVRKTTFESYDRIEGIARLSVSPKDLFDAGVAFRAYHGVAIVPHIWSDLNQKKQILHQDSNIQKHT